MNFIPLPPNITPELIKELKEKKAERTAEDKKILAKHLSVRERLEHNLGTEEVIIEIPDNDLNTPIKLRFHKLNPVEHDKLTELIKDCANPTKSKEAVGAINTILENKSMDVDSEGKKELTAEFWGEGTGYSADVRSKIILKLMTASVFPDPKFMEEINKFR